MASAKRRRAVGGNSEDLNSSDKNSSSENIQQTKYSPVQLLHLHEIRIKKMEELIKNMNNENKNLNTNITPDKNIKEFWHNVLEEHNKEIDKLNNKFKDIEELKIKINEIYEIKKKLNNIDILKKK